MKRITTRIIPVLKYAFYLILWLLLALVIRLLLCNFYIIPSDSMMPTLLPGDYILVNKLTYGARIFTNLKFDENSDPPLKRIPGMGNVQRNDVVVFNGSYQEAWDTIRMNLEKIYVKRCIGLPGDSLSIIDGFYRITGIDDSIGYIPGQEYLFRYHNALDSTILRTIPFDSTTHWDIVNFGPFYIPAVGTTILLNPRNYLLYHKLMIYETLAVIRQKDSQVFINDTLRSDYTFRSNWYFMAGDRAINSQDSRYFGLIPEAYIIGKASLVISSKDKNTGKQRWNRMLKRIK
jgi:signal peptidase I, bacterial type